MSTLADVSPTLNLLEPVLFFAIALLLLISAWAIVLSQNIVRMAVYLLLTLGAAAGLYFMLHAELLAAIQLIVYAGGTLILIIFGVMLTSKNPFMQLQVQFWEKLVAVFVASSIAGLLIFAWVRSRPPVGAESMTGETNQGLIQRVGAALLSTHLVAFELAGVLLLVVMIGAAYMARRRTQDEQPPEAPDS